MSYVNPGSVLAIGVTFIVTSVSIVGARFALRIHHRMLGIEDWLCLAAMVLVVGQCVVMIVGYATDSFGTHTPPMRPETMTAIDPSQQMVKKLEYAAYCIFIPALTLLKLSTLFFYKRLFRGRAFTIAFWCLFTLSLAWGVSFLVAWAAGCQSITDHWTSLLTLTTKCINTFTLLICQSVLDVVVDLALLALPIPFVFALQIPIRRRIAICSNLLIGALAIGCGIYRMIIVIQTLSAPFLANPTVAGMRADDIKGVVTALVIWSMLELGIGMVAICLPTLRKLLKKEFRDSVAQSFRSLIRASQSSSLSLSRKSGHSDDDGQKRKQHQQHQQQLELGHGERDVVLRDLGKQKSGSVVVADGGDVGGNLIPMPSEAASFAGSATTTINSTDAFDQENDHDSVDSGHRIVVERSFHVSRGTS